MATLSSDGKSVTVVKGDTLSEIAVTYKSTIGSSLTLQQRINKLCELNDIDNANFIVVGQVIKLTSDSSGSSGGSSTTKKTSTTSRATIKAFGLQSDTDRTVYASWTWTKSNTKEYKVIWYYDTGDGIWFVGNESTETYKQSVYNAPSNANRVKFKVKPISKTHKVNNKETTYWTASWSTEKTYSFRSNPPTTPAVPNVEIKDLKFTASLNNLDVNATSIQFQIVRDDKTVFNTGTATIKTSAASYSCSVTAGSEYKVRCRAVRGKIYSDWSEYSNNYGTEPAAPGSILYVKALSETSVQIKWEKVSNATSCEIEYTTEKRYFDSSNAVSSMSVNSKEYAEITGLETGKEYFFRVRAVNRNGESAWTSVVSIVIGKKPAAPTTWSSTTTAIIGEQLILYWVHNAEDGSSQTYAELELYIGGEKVTKTIKNTTDEEEKDKTSFYNIDTSVYTEGTQIQWRVRTAGITKTYGDWSIQRTIDIYAAPTIELNFTDVNGNTIETLTSFPAYVSGLAGPNTQTPIGYHLSVVAGDTYQAVDQIGNFKMVKKGDAVYSKYFDTYESLLVELSANNIDLENNVSYTIICTVSMNSGLTAESQINFTVSWTDEQYEPNAEISYDNMTYSTHIRPYCEDADGNLIEGITLSVYRREFDGRFVELATNINNTSNTFITDPHPALDYARYRVVAITTSTGAVSFYDLPGYPVGEKGIIIQWDEDWTSFDTTNEDEMEQPAWSGSLLRLPYNVDVSDSNQSDVELIEYIGRSHPVSYYGTQIGSSSTWSVEIESTDKDTLYALRRLAIWMGDVYVREPSGSGYWANVSVSFSQKHCELTIPVTLNVTRVEGGI